MGNKAIFKAEFHQESKDMDETVYYMVMYEETRRKPGIEDHTENR
jgi:phage regulator Rha-like protein